VLGALLGFAGISLAALLTLYGVLRTGRAPAHLADVTGMSLLVDQLQEERDELRRQLAECRAENERLRSHG